MLDIFKRAAEVDLDDLNDEVSPRKKSKFENKYYISDAEFSSGRWMVIVFRHFSNQRQVVPQDILKHAIEEKFVIEGKWKDQHQGIRSYISLWNKQYREMHPGLNSNAPCFDGCERTGPHRICSKGRKPVYYWMRSRHYDEIYNGRTVPAPPVPQARPVPSPRTRPPKMPRRRPEFASVPAPFGHDFSSSTASSNVTTTLRLSTATLPREVDTPIFPTADERDAAIALFNLGDDPLLFGDHSTTTAASTSSPQTDDEYYDSLSKMSEDEFFHFFLGFGKKEEHPKQSIVLDSQSTDDATHVGGYYPVFSGGAKKRKSSAKKSAKKSKRRTKRKAAKKSKRRTKRKAASF
ncbi:hypothetical protein GGF31_003411 [Allomyces arbusculus]|nr:hypothetical protein GGF31_003411 [Allomyces arbusculus]